MCVFFVSSLSPLLIGPISPFAALQPPNLRHIFAKKVYVNAIDSLSDDDKKLPQVLALLPLLKRGIGIHHGGLLPILKEVVEILFSEGLIKALFATETFSIGINMPAKTVIFTKCRKWDGTANRWLSSGEYIQMSGRAGRRGKDDRGIVIQMMDQEMEPAVCKGILYGDPDPLNSSYHISYNMLLNMMRVEDVDPEFLIKASFHQYQQESEAPGFDAQADEFEASADAIQVKENDLVGQYYGLKAQLELVRNNIMKTVTRPDIILPFMQPGRLLKLKEGSADWGWGVVVSQKKKQGTGSGGEAGKQAAESDAPMFTIDVLVKCVKTEEEIRNDEQNFEPPLSWKVQEDSQPFHNSDADAGVMKIHNLLLSDITDISAVRLKVDADPKPKQARATLEKSLAEVFRRFPAVPMLNFVNDMKITSSDFAKLLERAEKLTKAMKSHHVSRLDADDRIERLKAYDRKTELLESAKLMRRKSRKAQTMVMKDELRKMKKVLKYMGHVDGTGVVQLKGRTACEINTANDLVVTELTFGGTFAELSVEQTVALLSCFTFDEKVKEDTGDPAKGLRPGERGDPCLKAIAAILKKPRAALFANEDTFYS